MDKSDINKTPVASSEELAELGELREEAKAQEAVAETLVKDAPKPEANTRHLIAVYFILGYLILFGIILVGYPIYNLVAYNTAHTTQLNIKIPDNIQMFSSVTGPLIGFVLGYYFKTKNEH
jgi:hypothetical protein